ncbi:MAG TPA: arsenate reductase ArsC [Candidatus Polarisedimenticolaceae bacterium]|nr:arsenate reductase ArsC [Candidatus Polarisedimenticolaceae bacterium]
MGRLANILVVCTRNSARSQIAEAYLRRHVGDRFDVYSAGVDPSTVHPLTRRVLEEAGFDVSRHTAKNVRDFLGRLPVHTLIVVCDKADQRCPSTFPGLVERLFWPFDDPAAATGSDEERLAAFRRVRDRIEARVRDWVGAGQTRA